MFIDAMTLKRIGRQTTALILSFLMGTLTTVMFSHRPRMLFSTTNFDCGGSGPYNQAFRASDGEIVCLHGKEYDEEIIAAYRFKMELGYASRVIESGPLAFGQKIGERGLGTFDDPDYKEVILFWRVDKELWSIRGPSKRAVLDLERFLKSLGCGADFLNRIKAKDYPHLKRTK